MTELEAFEVLSVVLEHPVLSGRIIKTIVRHCHYCFKVGKKEK